MINKKVLDWIEGYVLSRVLIFGDFAGTVSRSDLIFDVDTTTDYFRMFEGQRIQSLSLPVKSRNLSTLLGEIEACFREGWILMDNGKWTEADQPGGYDLTRETGSGNSRTILPCSKSNTSQITLSAEPLQSLSYVTI